MSMTFIQFLTEMDDGESKADMIRRHREEKQYVDATTDDNETNDDNVYRKRVRALQQRMNNPDTPPEQKRALRVQLRDEQEKLRRK